MEHALLAVLLFAVPLEATGPLDAELERRLRPDPAHDVALAEAGEAAAQDFDALLLGKLEEERNIEQFREHELPAVVLSTDGMWLQPEALEELEPISPQEAPPPAQLAQMAPAPPRPQVGGGQLLIQGEPLPPDLRRDIEERAKRLAAPEK